jgi:integrase/recombinase XerD
MHNVNAFHVSFILRKNKKHPELGQLYCRITVNGKHAEFSIKHQISIKQWCNVSNSVRGSSSAAQIVNNSIERVRVDIYEAYKELNQEGKFINPGLIKARHFGQDSNNKTLRELLTYHNNRKNSILKEGTLKNYDTTEKYLLDFISKKRKSSDVYLKQIDYEFIIDFENYLRNKDKINNNGLMKHMERFKKLLNLAEYLEWIDKNPGHKFKLKFEKSEREFLTEEELQLLASNSFGKPCHQINKDIFVFACYTGLSYIDVYNLTSQNIQIGIDGQKWIYTKREKSNVPVKVPLLDEAKEIIDKYREHPKVQITGKLLPIYTNQKTNKYIQEVAQKLGIEKNLTFHIARHTFATTVTLCNGVPIETVSKLLGHTKIATTQIYARVVDKKISHDMGSLKKILEAKKEEMKKVNSK